MRWRLGSVLRMIVSLSIVGGCSSVKMRNDQLEKVAKDWSMVIRASQVIPVYPLTEDLQPGDILLVTTPIKDQVDIYKDKGFLPLDQHLKRRHLSGWRDFYRGRYGIVDSTTPPTQWRNGDGTGNWKLAPHAAFPTYTFSVDSKTGGNLAIPIQSIPFAMGFMNTSKASGSVTIADAYSYGMDIVSVQANVVEWAGHNRQILSAFEPVNDNQYFLRIITRVYVAGRVNVTISNDDSRGIGAQAGAGKSDGGEKAPDSASAAETAEPRTESTPNTAAATNTEATAAMVTAAAKQLTKATDATAPGAAIKFVTATSRSVSMSETFNPPLVVGYVGFDMPILRGGRLGAAISTLGQLTRGASAPERPVTLAVTNECAAYEHMFAAITKEAAAGSEAADSLVAHLDLLSRLLPGKFPFSLYEVGERGLEPDDTVRAGQPVVSEGFRSVLSYLGWTTTTITRLRPYVDEHPDDSLKDELEAALKARADLVGKLKREPAFADAVDYVFLNY